jgi:hypothetical protein
MKIKRLALPVETVVLTDGTEWRYLPPRWYEAYRKQGLNLDKMWDTCLTAAELRGLTAAARMAPPQGWSQ